MIAEVEALLERLDKEWPHAAALIREQAEEIEKWRSRVVGWEGVANTDKPLEHAELLDKQAVEIARLHAAAARQEPIKATCFHTIHPRDAVDDHDFTLMPGRYALYPSDLKLYAAPVPAGATAAWQEPLTFDVFRQANVSRCLKWHPAGIESWSPSDWLTAVAGEFGELASLLKMRNRERDGLPGNKFSPSNKQVADEIADVLTYLDLLAAALGVNLGNAVVEKFNEVSERVGFPDRLPIYTAPVPAGDAVSVPLELTDRMYEEGKIMLECMLQEHTSIDLRLIYASMIAARPK
jgi:NTP pyrophosphatase (non-canonical NTP hydrolase)